MYRQSEKNSLSSNISSTCPHNMVNFGPLAAEIISLVWGTHDLDLWPLTLVSGHRPTWRVTWSSYTRSLKFLCLSVLELWVLTSPIGYHWQERAGHLEARFQGEGVIPLPIYWYHSKGNWMRYNFAADSFYIMKLDGCIVWNAHNTVLGEEALLTYIVPVCYVKTGRYGKT